MVLASVLNFFIQKNLEIWLWCGIPQDMASCLLSAVWVWQATCWFSASHTKREKNNKEKIWKDEIWRSLKCSTFLNIVLRLGLDWDGWFRCHSLSPGKAPFPPVMDCWRLWVVGKLCFKSFLWIRTRKSNISQKHRISNYWVPLTFALKQLDTYHGPQNGCWVWWFVGKLVVRGTPKVPLWSNSNRKGIWPWFSHVPGGYPCHKASK